MGIIIASAWAVLLLVMLTLFINYKTGCLSCCTCRGDDDIITFKEPIYIAGTNPYGGLINKIQEKYKVNNF